MFILLPNISSQKQIAHDFVFIHHCNDGFKKTGFARHVRYAHLNYENTLS